MKLLKLLRRQKLKSLILPRLLGLLDIRIISRNVLTKGYDKVNLLYFGEKDYVPSIPLKSDNFLGDIPLSVHNNSTEFHGGCPFVCRINNVKLVGQTASAFDSNNNIITEVNSSPLGNLEPRLYDLCSLKDPFTLTLSQTEPKSIQTACSLVSARSKKYFHWFIDNLTRLEGFEHYHLVTGEKPVLIVDSNLSQWQIQSLKLLGYSEDDWLEWNTNILEVDRLIVPSFRQPGNRISPSAIQWFRQKILQSPYLPTLFKEIDPKELDFSEKIFISRRKASGRQVVNEGEILEFLKKYGFKEYVLEDLTFQEQVLLFKNAKFVVAPHGAGLTNMLFSENKINLIEFVNSDVAGVYFLISSILGFNYFSLECKSDRSFTLNSLKGRADMVVDLDELNILLKKIL